MTWEWDVYLSSAGGAASGLIVGQLLWTRVIYPRIFRRYFCRLMKTAEEEVKRTSES